MSVPVPLPAEPRDLATVVASHQADVWRYLRYLGADRAEADDLVQETFLAAFRSGFVHQGDQPTACYLRTTARRQLLLLRRRESRGVSEVALEAAEQVWAEQLGDGLVDPYLEALGDCLEHLEGRSRRALDLHYTHRESRQAIADRLGMKPDGVKTLLRRTRDKLRECIESKLKTNE